MYHYNNYLLLIVANLVFHLILVISFYLFVRGKSVVVKKKCCCCCCCCCYYLASATKEEVRDLYNELEIMTNVGYHPNLVNLLGACTEDGLYTFCCCWLCWFCSRCWQWLHFIHTCNSLPNYDYGIVVSYRNVPHVNIFVTFPSKNPLSKRNESVNFGVVLFMSSF